MIDDAYRYGRLDRLPPRRRRFRADLLVMTAAAAIAVGALSLFTANPDTAPAPETTGSLPATAQAEILPARYAWLLDPTPALGARTQSLSQSASLGAAFEPEPESPLAKIVAAKIVAAKIAVAEIAPDTLPTAKIASVVEVAPGATSLPRPMARFAQTLPAQIVPLPVRRPADLRTVQVAALSRPSDRLLAPRPKAAAQETAEADRSFFDTVFGAKPATSGPVLAYAGVDTEGLGMSPRRPAVAPQAGAGTAVYDISAARVTLPNGEVLEAHSGLGASMDNPGGVHLRMRGATPPGTYDLTEREALFHGVRALRLNPVGGPGAIHNRNGLLTHTYMLGSSGASNGCISFRNYNRFLQAYLNGEVRRVVVVAGAKQDAFPAIASRLFGR